MVDQKHEDGNNGAAPTPAPVPPLTKAGASRRRMAGLGAILTVTSTPGMATMCCTTPSGSLSGGLVSNAPGGLVCEGRSPGYWKQSQHPWGSAGVSPNAPFKSVFPCFNRMNTYGQKTLLQMLTPQSFDTANIGMHLVATYLNVRAHKISFLTEATVIAIWNQWSSTGYYVPMSGATPWNASDIVRYLRNTMS